MRRYRHYATLQVPIYIEARTASSAAAKFNKSMRSASFRIELNDGISPHDDITVGAEAEVSDDTAFGANLKEMYE